MYPTADDYSELAGVIEAFHYWTERYKAKGWSDVASYHEVLKQHREGKMEPVPVQANGKGKKVEVRSPFGVDNRGIEAVKRAVVGEVSPGDFGSNPVDVDDGEVIDWVAMNLAFEPGDVDPKTAPNSAAWAMWRDARASSSSRNAFWSNIYAKRALSRQKREEGMVDDGRLLDRLIGDLVKRFPCAEGSRGESSVQV